MSSSPALAEWDWLHSADPLPLLDHLFPMHGFHSTPEMPRKLRLYYAACARRRYADLTAFQRGLLEAAEHWADRTPTRDLREELVRMGEENLHRAEEPDSLARLGQMIDRDPREWLAGVRTIPREEHLRHAWLLFQAVHEEIPARSQVHPSLHSADLLREVFPNPFRPPEWRERWRTGDSVGIARKMYTSNRFHAMGELADALEEAGCQTPTILLHCREADAQHFRGCWVVDWLLDPAGTHFGLQ